MKISTLKKLNHFSLILSKCFYKINWYTPGRWLGYLRQKRTIPFLETFARENNLLDKNYEYNNLEEVKNTPIFIMWFQGFDNLPPVIEKCIDSIKNHINSKYIIYISYNNIKEYVQIPEYILEKVDSGKISKTHFSDIARVALLRKYGGTWIDAAVFLTDDISDAYFKREFYSPSGINSEIRKDFRYLFNNTPGWNISFQGSNVKEFPLYVFLTDFYYKYFSKYDYISDYFQTDFLISIFLRNNSNFKRIIESQTVNNQDEFELALLMNKPINKKTLKKLSKISNTYIHKLTYKKNWVRNKNGKQTVYDYVMFKNEKNI